MNVYRVGGNCKRRYLDGGVKSLVSDGQEHRRCSLCGVTLDYPPPESYWKNVVLNQGSFVSNILWGFPATLYVTDELKNAFQNEGFEGIEFEKSPIIEDCRPSRDRKKLPLDQIPQFYRVKFLASISYHQDFIELYDVKSCPECGATRSKYTGEGLLIFEGKSHPGTNFFGISFRSFSGGHHCSERGKAFLESYPKTYCDFTQAELRD